MLINTVLQPNKKAFTLEGDGPGQYALGMIDQVSDHCMRWCVHRAFRRWRFGSLTPTRLDSNLCVDKGFFLRLFTLCEATGRSTKLRKKQSYKSVFYQKKRSAFPLQPYLVWKFLSHWSRKTSPKVRGTLKSLPKVVSKRSDQEECVQSAKNRKECCFLCCFSSSPGHWQTSKLPQEGRVLSDRKINLQATLSSRSQLESSAGKPFTSSSANQTQRQELRTTPLEGARMEGNTTSEGQNDNFSTERRFFQSVNMIPCHSAACTRKMATLG